MSRRGFSRRQLADFEWREERELAETIPCRDCHTPAGTTCVNLANGQPLVKQSAHRSRIDDALQPRRPAPPEPPAPRLPTPPVLKTNLEKRS